MGDAVLNMRLGHIDQNLADSGDLHMHFSFYVVCAVLLLKSL